MSILRALRDLLNLPDAVAGPGSVGAACWHEFAPWQTKIEDLPDEVAAFGRRSRRKMNSVWRCVFCGAQQTKFVDEVLYGLWHADE